MSEQIIEQIKCIVPPPEKDGSNEPNNWQEVERKLGLELPEQYKQIIDIYGDYYWFDFLYFLNPFSLNPNLNLFAQIQEVKKYLTEARNQFPEIYLFSIYPEDGGLLPFIYTDNGDEGFWITKGQPNDWPIMFKNQRFNDFEVRFISCDTFLFHNLKGLFHSIVLPKLI